MKIIYLKPKSSYITELRSDTLWGHIMIGIKMLYGDERFSEILNTFILGKPHFIISSAFNYSENNKKELFFPKPILNTKFESNGNLQDILFSKKYKKFRYINKGLLELLINGQISENEIIRIIKEYETLTNGFSRDMKSKAFESSTGKSDKHKEVLISYYNQPNNIQRDELKTSINNLTNSTKDEKGDGMLHYFHEKYINDNSGLFFLIEGVTEEAEAALRYLSHIGTGKKHNVGKGVFKIEVNDFEIKTPAEFNSLVTLSFYTPTKDEAEYFTNNSERLAYKIEQRAGRLAKEYITDNRFQKDAVTGFAEGSVIPKMEKEYLGANFNVMKGTEYDITHYGFAFGISANLKESEDE